MDVTHIINAASDWWPTVLFAGLLLGFFVAMGRTASRSAGWPDDRAPESWDDVLRAALAGIGRLQELHRRGALPPWDDLTERAAVDRRPLTADRSGGPHDQ